MKATKGSRCLLNYLHNSKVHLRALSWVDKADFTARQGTASCKIDCVYFPVHDIGFRTEEDSLNNLNTKYSDRMLKSKQRKYSARIAITPYNFPTMYDRLIGAGNWLR